MRGRRRRGRADERGRDATLQPRRYELVTVDVTTRDDHTQHDDQILRRSIIDIAFLIMAGLVPAMHVFQSTRKSNVDAPQ